nr:hypothetical protein [Sphaerisporangium perillae]
MLGREVRRAADRPRGALDPGVQRLGDTEVDHPWPVRAEQDVAGVELAVCDPGLVDGDERGHGADREPVQRRAPQRALVLDGLLEGRPVDVLADHVRPVAREAGLDDLRRAEGGHLPEFVDLGEEPFGAGQAGVQQFDRDVLFTRLLCQINGAFVAFAESADDVIAT